MRSINKYKTFFSSCARQHYICNLRMCIPICLQKQKRFFIRFRFRNTDSYTCCGLFAFCFIFLDFSSRPWPSLFTLNALVKTFNQSSKNHIRSTGERERACRMTLSDKSRLRSHLLPQLRALLYQVFPQNPLDFKLFTVSNMLLNDTP